MYRPHLMSAMKLTRSLCVLALVAGLTGCQKRAELRLKIRQTELSLVEQQSTLKTIKDTQIPNLGKYANPRPSHIEELTGELQSADDELSQLKQERDAAAAVNADMQRQIDDYLAKYLKL